MNFYIDFDHTLYNTNDLIEDMMKNVSEYILEHGDFNGFAFRLKKMYPNKEIIQVEKNFASIYKLIKDNFKRPEDTKLKIEYNIFALIEAFSVLFNCNCSEMKNRINEIVSNGKKYLYDDTKSFLKDLKKRGHKTYILSHERYDLDFQSQKIRGSGIIKPDFINAIILTKDSKANLTSKSLEDKSRTVIVNLEPSTPVDIDYKNGIFIDDRPKDLEAYISSVYEGDDSPQKIRIYRIARPNATYSTIPFENPKSCLFISRVKNLSDLTKKIVS